jgi:hypothetical protein
LKNGFQADRKSDLKDLLLTFGAAYWILHVWLAVLSEQ